MSPAPPHPTPTAAQTGSVGLVEPDTAAERLHQAWLSSVMATGPPDDPLEMELAAIDIIADMLGGRIVEAA